MMDVITAAVAFFTFLIAVGVAMRQESFNARLTALEEKNTKPGTGLPSWAVTTRKGRQRFTRTIDAANEGAVTKQLMLEGVRLEDIVEITRA